ncbi:Uncharacterized protein APZ42_020247 [Daphnia magna]|nr:Uncharacterized protein APZ42_020247 [Daphnia magna]
MGRRLQRLKWTTVCESWKSSSKKLTSRDVGQWRLASFVCASRRRESFVSLSSSRPAHQANNDQFHCWTNHPQSRNQDKDGTSHCRNCESNSKFGVDEIPFYLVFFMDIFRIKSNGTKV